MRTLTEQHAADYRQALADVCSALYSVSRDPADIAVTVDRVRSTQAVDVWPLTADRVRQLVRHNDAIGYGR